MIRRQHATSTAAIALRRPSRRRGAGLAAASVVALCITLAAGPAAAPDPASAATRPITVAFECFFTEPFLAFTIASNGAWFEHENGAEKLTGAAVSVTSSKITLTSTAASDGVLKLVITHQEGSDGMSDYVSDWRGQFGTYDGRCTRFPDSSVAMDVIGVADNDVLNIRSTASASARIVTKVQPEGTVFATGTKSGSWLKVAAADYPASGEGRIVVKPGWAKSSFLRKRT